MLEANEVIEAFSGTSQTTKAWGDLFQKHHNLVEGDDIFPSTFVPYAVARSMKNVAEKEKSDPAQRSLSVVLEISALGGPINHLRFAKSRGYSCSPLWC